MKDSFAADGNSSLVVLLLIFSLRAPSFFAPDALGLAPTPKVGALSFDTTFARSSCSATEAVPKFAVSNFPASTTAGGGGGNDEWLGVVITADVGGAKTEARSSEDNSGELFGRLSSGAEVVLPIAGHEHTKKGSGY